MKTVTSISGGKSSGFLARHYKCDYLIFALVCIDDKDCSPKDPYVIDYVNRKLEKTIPEYGEFIATAEDDDTLVAMMELEQLLGKEITWTRGISYDKLLDGRQTRLPSWARRYCTEYLKMIPIFYWWMNEVGEKVNMNIGFRFDEFDRVEDFFNKNDKRGFSIPVTCRTKGQRKQRHEFFDWRKVRLPLVSDGITQEKVIDWAKSTGINFPEESNCVGCFDKKFPNLAVMANKNPAKMRWFARQEQRGKGFWLDSQIAYETIINNASNWIPEMAEGYTSCDSGGCTD
jgi:hypothetical protein